jgi:membrane fusion protein (multidrug efflux system)
MPDEPKPLATPAPTQPPQPQPRARWPLYLAMVMVIVVMFSAAVLLIVFRPRATMYTDDAYVTAHYATIAPRIVGQITTVAVDDNQAVRAGQVLAIIDDRDYRVALTTAEAQLERDRAQVDDTQSIIARQPTIIDQARAQVGSATAQFAFAQANQRRYRNLATTGAGTLQDRQQAETAAQQAEAALAGSAAAEEAARRQIPIQDAQQRAALAQVKADEARVEQAKLNLSYTYLVAPIDGTVAQRAVQVGNFVAPGSALMAVVPLDQAYVEANYLEVQLRDILPGQHAHIHVDAYDVDIEGIVDSVPPASGAAFAPIEPNNATGNFTKIVQRLPVKIIATPGQELAKLLRIGLSVETYIDTRRPDVIGHQESGADRIIGRH